MKVVLDVDKLLAEGHISTTEYARLRKFAAEDTGSLAFNILIGFGVVATTVGALALLRSAAASIPLGLLLMGAGISLLTYHAKKWGLLGSILILVGSTTAAGGVLVLTDGGVVGFLVVTLLCLVGAVLVRSGLLMAMAALALAGTVGAATSYGHGTYELVVQRPTVTVILFGALSWGAYMLSLRVGSNYEGLALVFARTSLLLVNVGFWVGSLWGDSLWYPRKNWNLGSGEIVPDWVFALAWAIALIVTGVWAVRKNRRWVVNLLAVFGAIHFYTQYFERLGATPGSILLAGLMALGIAVAMVLYNKADPVGSPTLSG